MNHLAQHYHYILCGIAAAVLHGFYVHDIMVSKIADARENILVWDKKY